MINILKDWIKVTQDGDVVSAKSERTIDDENGDYSLEEQQLVFRCPVCGHVLEENDVRTNCSEHGVCCDWCHAERHLYEKMMFERAIQIETQRLRLLESKAVDSIPLIKWIRQFTTFRSLSRLNDMNRRLEEQRNGNNMPQRRF